LSKSFVSDSFLPRPAEETVFKVAWPQLQSKAYTSSFHQYLNELEEKVLKQAKEKSLLIEKEAYEQGFAQGEKDGLKLGEKRIETMINQFEGILAGVKQQQNDLQQALEKEGLHLLLSLGKKVIHHELSMSEETVCAVIGECLQYAIDRRKVVVHLNPVDAQYLLSHPEKSLINLNDEGGVKLIEDHSISRGGCFLETSYGEIDGTVESRLDEIVSQIWEQWNQSHQPPGRSAP
jgi:flagellar assembly protein FliH